MFLYKAILSQFIYVIPLKVLVFEMTEIIVPNVLNIILGKYQWVIHVNNCFVFDKFNKTLCIRFTPTLFFDDFRWHRSAEMDNVFCVGVLITLCTTKTESE